MSLLPILLSILGVLAIALIAFQWERVAIRSRLRRGARVADTTRGPVEYAAVGSGPPVVVLHGGMGGWDQGIALGVSLLAPMDATDDDCGLDYFNALRVGDGLLQDRFTLIAPSRVGYLRTPLPTGRTPAEGADATAALLDHLNIDSAIVIGVSGGGPTAL